MISAIQHLVPSVPASRPSPTAPPPPVGLSCLVSFIYFHIVSRILFVSDILFYHARIFLCFNLQSRSFCLYLLVLTFLVQFDLLSSK